MFRIGDAVCDMTGALYALAAAVRAAPAAFRSRLSVVEEYVWKAMIDNDSTTEFRQAAVLCLSLLPKVTGETHQP